MSSKLVLGIAGGLLCIPFMTAIAQAQVTPDGTLNTTVTQSGNTYTITNGTAAGTNLYHSFQQFSVPTGGSATFDLNTTPTISTIFSRVTGGNVSTIDGLIRTINSSNPVSLFLMNPAGIIFGPNAALNIGGSFVGTTANSIKFANGAEFISTATPLSTSLLTVSVPIGLQMGNNPGAIAVNAAQLQVPSGNTLALIGGDITQTGGQLRVDGGNGRIELASLGGSSQAGLQSVPGGWSVDSRSVQTFQDLQFTQGADVDGSGTGSAAITVAGRNLLLSNESKFQSYNRGDLNGGAIAVNAASSILIQENSEIRTDVDGAGNAGSISISAPQITLYNQGSIVSVAWGGTGNAGDISLSGKEVTFNSDPRFLIDDASSKASAVVTVTFSQGNSGNIKILSDVLTYANGAGLVNMTLGQGNSGTTTLISNKMSVRNSTGGNTTTGGSGNGGDLNIITDSFYMDGSSGYTTTSFGKQGGKAGNINVTARSIVARDDGGFNSDTFGGGNAGNITFRADYIELDDAQLNSRTSSSGNAGTINVAASTLKLLNGAQLNVATKASGNGGNIIVNANTVELSGETTRGVIATQNTGIISSVLPDSKKPTISTGNGGNINLTSSSLVIRDGALISASTSAGQGNGGNIDLQVDRLDVVSGGQVMASTRSQGNAGTITVNARDRILLSGEDALHTERQSAYIPEQDYSDVEYNIGPFSGIFGNATVSSTGNGGSIQLTTGTLQVQDGAMVSVNSQSIGNAGNLTVSANTVNLDTNASLSSAASSSGKAGNLNLQASRTTLWNNSQITTRSTGTGDGGTVNLTGDWLTLRNGSSITATTAAGDGGNINLNLSKLVYLRDFSQLNAEAGGTGNGGNININALFVVGWGNSDIIANAVRGRGGSIQITTQGIFGLKFRPQLTPENDITASSQFGVSGNVQINNLGVDPNTGVEQLSANFVDPSRQIATDCDARGSRFVATGRGGLPSNPNEQVSNDRPWNDIRDVSQLQSSGKPIAHTPHPTPHTPIIEASGIKHHSNGTLELIATPEPTSSFSAQATCAEAIAP